MPIASPDQGATGETATLVELAEADETTTNSKATDTGDRKRRWRGETEEVYPKRTLIFCWP